MATLMGFSLVLCGDAPVRTITRVAGADGHVSAREQQLVQKGENRQSRRIAKQKHDAQTRQ